MSIIQEHVNWLSLIDINGPFLSLNTLQEVFPNGLDVLDKERVGELRVAYTEWLDAVGGSRVDEEIHNAWLQWVLRSLLNLPDRCIQPVSGQNSELAHKLRVHVPEHNEWLQPDLVIGNPPSGGDDFTPRVLVRLLPPGESLSKAPNQAWQASHASRMALLLRDSGVVLGLLTNGEEWMLVNRPKDLDAASGFASWYASIWLDESITLQAFCSLLGRHRLFGVPAEESLEALFSKSLDERQEVTIQLGQQVQHAVQLLVQAFDQQARERQSLPSNIAPELLYEASLSVMMRLVFLLFAEEQQLLPLGEELYDRYYAVSTMLDELREAAEKQTEEVLERRFDAWARLLATFRMVYAGCEHDQLNLPAYGGRLFDPDRYPFLEGRPFGSDWRRDPADPLTISNRTVLHLLEALQTLPVKLAKGMPTERRRLSFRALDIEQIGHVYENLLDYTARRAEQTLFGIMGKGGDELEIVLDELEQQGDPLEWLSKQTGRTRASLERDQSKQLDAQALDRLRSATGNNPALFERLRPWAGLIRNDDYNTPVVILPGSVYTTSGHQRRSSGTHYTPRSLTEPIVSHTLEPLVWHGPAEGLPREQWKLHSPAKLLELKICDMAMGSGAFLVQACRYLADRLLEAWAEAEKRHPDAWIDQNGFVTSDYAKALPKDSEERLVLARRLVADRCLYGVDINPLASEMAKLSLWLITFAKGKPFTFLDHALRTGDSLLGISRLEQLSFWSLNWKESQSEANQITGFTYQIEQAVQTAIRERMRIASTPVLEARDSSNKAGWLASAEAATELARLGADLLIAVELHPNPKQREHLRLDWLSRFSLLLSSAEQSKHLTRQGQGYGLEAYQELRDEADAALEGKRPFHWPLEFPELFAQAEAPLEQMLAQAQAGSLQAPASSASGFSAFIGNPPFMGGQKLTGTMGDPYREYLVEHLGQGKRGSADLCAYFFLRAQSMLRPKGMAGLIATNTIAQGDTREVGLDQIVAQGASIIRAVPSRRWPGEAAVEVAHVYWRNEAWQNGYVLDEQLVNGITAYLTPPGRATGNPYRLVANANKSFQGSIVLGMGFVLEPEEAAALIAKDPRNKEALYPYLSGEDLNSRPDQAPSRWVINFQDWPLEQAETYPDLISIVREKVKSERDKLGDGNPTAKDRSRRWWQFARPTTQLYSTIADMQRVLCKTRHSPNCAFEFVTGKPVFQESLVVLALEDFSPFAVLSTTLHEVWAWQYGSTLGENTLRYGPSDCFETFPFPEQQKMVNLEAIGERYYQHRQQIMLERQEGLTKTYNRFHNPAEQDGQIEQLRQLHRQMDEAVAAAYGWSDLALEHGFHQTKQGLRFTISEAARREVLDRLLELNHARYAEEVAQGLHDKGASKAKKAAGKNGRGKKAKPADQDETSPQQESLF